MSCEFEKIVRYDIYCQSCQYYDTPENKDPCHTCLETPVNTNSIKPVNWKAGDEKYLRSFNE